MVNAKPVSTPLEKHFKPSKNLFPRTQDEKDYMERLPYASVVGNLMYSMIYTRPYVAQAMGVVSRFINNPGKGHWQAIKWIFRYLRGTSKYCLNLGGSNLSLQGFVDSDMARDLDGGRGTTRYVFIVGGGVVN